MLVSAKGSTFTLTNVLYVLGITRNLLSIPALDKVGLVLKFANGRCTIHDLNNGEIIFAHMWYVMVRIGLTHINMRQ